MAKNRIQDLNDHLFLALERLNDESYDSEQLQIEIGRARAISEVGGKIIELSKVTLESIRVKREYLGNNNEEVPPMFQPHSTTKLGEKNA